MIKKEALVIFAKNPEAGKVKTRLAATIGPDAALAVYRELLSHTASITIPLPQDKFVFYSDQVTEQDNWCDGHFFKKVQHGNDLGERMKSAFAAIFEKGYHKAVIIGTDCPGLTGDMLTKAFAELDSTDVVIGPAEDGGYYLLGMNRLHLDLFENINWSTASVFDETLKKCAALQLDYALLTPLHDIDEEKDLIHLQRVIT